MIKDKRMALDGQLEGYEIKYLPHEDHEIRIEVNGISMMSYSLYDFLRQLHVSADDLRSVANAIADDDYREALILRQVEEYNARTEEVQ